MSTEIGVIEADLAQKSMEVVAGVIEAANALTVTNPEHFVNAAEVIKGLKERKRKIEEFFAPEKQRWSDGHKAICAKEREYLKSIIEAIEIVDVKAVDYHRVQEQIRRAEQLRLEAEERTRAEEAKLAEASALEAMGEHEAAEQVISEPVAPAAPVLPKATPKVDGFGFRTTYEAEVINPLALCKAIADGRVPVSAVTPNMAVLNAQARAMKRAFNWPGCRAVEKTGTQTRRTVGA